MPIVPSILPAQLPRLLQTSDSYYPVESVTLTCVLKEPVKPRALLCSHHAPRIYRLEYRQSKHSEIGARYFRVTNPSSRVVLLQTGITGRYHPRVYRFAGYSAVCREPDKAKGSYTLVTASTAILRALGGRIDYRHLSHRQRRHIGIEL